MKIAIYCDGDFWHGRNLAQRLAKLAGGHNAPYWVAKIQGNVVRDARNNATLESSGWLVLRYWETDIRDHASEIANEVSLHVARRKLGQ